MRLLKVDRDHDGKPTLELTKLVTAETAPPYAVLSHTWLPNDEDEVSIQDVMQGASSGTGDKERRLGQDPILCGPGG